MTTPGWDAVHQFVPSVYPHDGVGGHVLRMARAQRDRGRRSEIFVEVVHPETADRCHHVSELDRHIHQNERTLFVYHFATGSILPGVLSVRPEPLAVQHHSLTPIDLIAPWAPEAVADLVLGRRQLQDLAHHAVLGIGDSLHNAIELDELGFEHTAVAPVMISAELGPSHVGSTTVGDPPTVLFVGRVVANKAHHDLIGAIAALRVMQPRVRLRLVGPVASPRYMAALERLVGALDLGDAVTFTGALSEADLDAEYRQADVFCCLSDHEGFGMPLIEAAHYGLPVVAFDAAAVSETVGKGAILLKVKDAATVATAIDRVLRDEQLRAELTTAATERLRDLEPSRAADSFENAIIALASRLDSEAERRAPQQ